MTKPENFCLRQAVCSLPRSVSRSKVFKTPFPDQTMQRKPQLLGEEAAVYGKSISELPSPTAASTEATLPSPAGEQHRPSASSVAASLAADSNKMFLELQ